MKRDYFLELENQNSGTVLPLMDVLAQLPFDDKGLIPVITQDAQSKDILMFAWMNRESLKKTLETKQMTYFSRSRQSLWVKGETSGHTQALVSMSFDCDGDAVLCQIEQQGAACHTGRRDCFYLSVQLKDNTVLIQ